MKKTRLFWGLFLFFCAVCFAGCAEKDGDWPLIEVDKSSFTVSGLGERIVVSMKNYDIW